QLERVCRMPVLDRGDEAARPVLVLLRRAHLPVECVPREPLVERPLPVREDRLRLLEGRQLVVLELHRRLRRAEERARVALDRLPRREEVVRNVAERLPLTRPRIRADLRRALQRLPAEFEPDAVLRVAAVDLPTDADARVDVAAAALHEESEP